MSTKNLARTVIEGGRSSCNRWERRFSNSQTRRAARTLSAQLPHCAELDDVVYAPRQPVYRMFSDKLSPAERWLESQLGRPWRKVEGELYARFDTRTTAGRHILFDHLLRDVDVSGLDRWCKFVVDRHGVLRRAAPRARSRWSGYRSPLPEPDAALRAWLGVRRVGERDAQLFWFLPTRAGYFRQAQRLSPEDEQRFRALPRWFREQYDAFALGPLQESN